MEKIKIYVEGVSIRDNEVEQAKLSFEQDKENLLKLKHEEKTLKGIVQNLKGTSICNCYIYFSHTSLGYMNLTWIL